MKTTITYLCALCMTFLSACSDDNDSPLSGTEGILDLSGIQARPAAEVSVHTRAIDEQLKVDIYDAGGTLLHSFEPGESNRRLQMEVGQYRLEAYTLNYHTEYAPTEKGAPKYYGEQAFSIEADKVNVVTLNVPMTNMAVSYTLPQDFDTWFDTYTFTLSDEAGTRSIQPAPGEVWYYDATAASLSYKLEATNTDGEPFASQGTITPTVAGTHYTVEYTFAANRQPVARLR